MLSSGVQKTFHINKIKLSHNRLTDDSIVNLIKKLNKNKKLNDVDFSYNRFSNLGGTCIASYISKVSCK